MQLKIKTLAVVTALFAIASSTHAWTASTSTDPYWSQLQPRYNAVYQVGAEPTRRIVNGGYLASVLPQSNGTELIAHK